MLTLIICPPGMAGEIYQCAAPDGSVEFRDAPCKRGTVEMKRKELRQSGTTVEEAERRKELMIERYQRAEESLAEERRQREEAQRLDAADRNVTSNPEGIAGDRIGESPYEKDAGQGRERGTAVAPRFPTECRKRIMRAGKAVWVSVPCQGGQR
ncbi:MAG: hypothetical protein ABFS23_07620 [Pseudomonadota bacterium]